MLCHGLGQTFLVAASPLDGADKDDTLDRDASIEGWIELRVVSSSAGSSATSRLVAQFDLPEIASDEPSTFKFRHNESLDMVPVGRENGFPFTSNAMNALQVVEIHFATDNLAYLIITNELFVTILRQYYSRNNPATFPRRFSWRDWARWTSLWDRHLGYESVDFTLNTKSLLLTNIAVRGQCVVAGSAPSLDMMSVMNFSLSIST